MQDIERPSEAFQKNNYQALVIHELEANLESSILSPVNKILKK